MAENIFSKMTKQSAGVTNMLTNGITDIASKANPVKVSKQRVKELIIEKAKMYEFIGMEVFDLYVAEQMNLEEVVPFCKKIKEINDEIELLEVEIAVAENICECGAKLQKGAKFCAACGKSADRESRIQSQLAGQASVIECVCGATIEPGAQMCMECGRRVVV